MGRKEINRAHVYIWNFPVTIHKPQALKYSATFCSPRNSAWNILPEEVTGPLGHPG